ncbi:hypothetical protein PMKS-001442 [Pichia membranifaciens]|uniref:SAGA complex subunit Spt7 n=1 Tax=Pichia membranifaciens TaxID=4926 RepID=A0A1Q2YEL5_9ASCO|nr:hypothetical protein PMKS-001442 [Pichia membranifaciens]
MSPMKKKRTLEVFKAGDEKHLWKIAKILFETGFFNCYLTPQQFNLLQKLLYFKGANCEDNSAWSSFLNGSLILRFKEDAGDDSNSNENMYMKPGYPTLRNLNATVRYLLYEKAVDYYFSQNLGETKEFQLLDNVVSDSHHMNSLEGNDMENNKFGDEILTDMKNTPKISHGEDDDYDDEEDDSNDKEDDNYDDDDDDDDDVAVDNKIEDRQKIDANKTDRTSKEPSKLETHKGEPQDGLLIDDATKDYVLLVSKEELLKKPLYPSVPELSADEDAIGKMVHPILGTSSAIESSIEKQNELKLIKNFNKIYHSFENDLPNILKKRKLERSDKQLEMSEDIPQKDESGDSDSKQVNKLMTLGGAVNLSLKNLLNRIEENRDKLGATDVELKNLIMDVRKNRSKWANYNRIGQEELYEACEKVVTELRGYTEHSTPFLNRVSKREAPNYYQVIKKPMDLNTVLKKLKVLQYQNKQQFVDDLMLIWQNCLTYNSDPKHFIRIDALAMRKKSLMLVPLIPDITIRDRTVVEREAAEREKEKEKEESQNVGRTSARGVGHKKAKKGRKGAGVESPVASIIDASDSAATPLDDTPADVKVTGTPISFTIERLNTEQNNTNNPSTLAEDDDAMDIDEEDEDDVENNMDENAAELNAEDMNEDADDLEISTWKTLTSTTRYKLCNERSKLFKDNKIQPNTEATIRTKSQMYNFCKYLEDESKIVLHRSRKYFDENDDPYLIEYDVAGGVPSIQHQSTNFDSMEESILEKMISDGKTLDDLGPSGYKVKLDGSNSLVLDNISLMQDIRKVCFKINLIRTMQTSQFVHQSQFVAPNFPKIKFKDIDPMSKLATRDLMTEEIASHSLQKSVSAIAMANGFQSTAPSCAVLLTEIAKVYMCNLAKSMKLHLESNSINKMPIKGNKPVTCRDVLQLVLEYNGVEKPDVLYSYYKEHMTKQNRKLIDLKYSLENFLRDLLRPGMQDISETQFNDDSEQFVNGDFSDEIGEDFFGFKELGLDKEFGLLTSNIPLHLLQSKLSYQFNQMNKHMAKRIYEDFEEVKFPKLRKRDITKQIGILQPFYEDVYIKSKLMYNKQLKKFQTQTLNGETPEEPFHSIDNEEDLVLIEDNDLPHKQRNNRPKIPPNGKITQIKKKFIATAFFVEKQDEIESRFENMIKKREADAQKELKKKKESEDEQQAADEDDNSELRKKDISSAVHDDGSKEKEVKLVVGDSEEKHLSKSDDATGIAGDIIVGAVTPSIETSKPDELNDGDNKENDVDTIDDNSSRSNRVPADVTRGEYNYDGTIKDEEKKMLTDNDVSSIKGLSNHKNTTEGEIGDEKEAKDKDDERDGEMDEEDVSDDVEK